MRQAEGSEQTEPQGSTPGCALSLTPPARPRVVRGTFLAKLQAILKGTLPLVIQQEKVIPFLKRGLTCKRFHSFFSVKSKYQSVSGKIPQPPLLPTQWQSPGDSTQESMGKAHTLFDPYAPVFKESWDLLGTQKTKITAFLNLKINPNITYQSRLHISHYKEFHRYAQHTELPRPRS